MYKSPIAVCQNVINNLNDFMDRANKEFENDIVCRVRLETRIDIDKDELIKALHYDRAQYDKGYADGHKDGYHKGFHDALDQLKKSVEETYDKEDQNERRAEI